ncbi:MAG: FAD-binding oxidoreductase, partial [Dehalococcoidia bacterium]
MWQPLTLRSWGGVTSARVLASRPETEADVAAAFAQAGEDGIIAHGAGRSYGDAALNDGGRIILTQRLRRLLSFDEESGDLVCEPGVTFGELLDVFLPRGYLFPVSPGTAHTTIGGAVANDIHGKNHDYAGSFGAHVQWLDLMLPSGDVVRTSREQDPSLFAATIGGVGLTGFILRVCFRMVRVPSGYLRVHEQRIRDLDAFMAAFAACRERATFSVGWIDGLAQGSGFGRGILQTAEFAGAEAGLSITKGRGVTLPFSLPGATLNSASVGLFNAAYLRRVPEGGRTRTRPIAPFFYPLDAMGHWNRMYGRRGFFQFQCVVPDAEAASGIPRLMQEIVRSRAGSFLNVLKTLGGEGPGHLSFPLRGYTLAIDFPNTAETHALLKRLESITLDHEGRVYLGKDAVLSPDAFRTMYPQHQELRAVLDRVDPQQRMSS